MAVDARAHITSDVLQEQAMLRRTRVWAVNSSGYTECVKAVAIKGHSGDEIRLSLADLGAALRVLKVPASALGYKSA